MLKIYKIIKFSFVLFLTFSTPARAGEITDTEWDFLNHFVVTFFQSGTSAPALAECTAFNQQGKPIGGGTGVFNGSVARVRIDVPEKYVKKSLKVSCRESNL